MTFRSRLLLFGYPLLEVATAYLLAQWIGWGWTILLLLIGFPIGFALMRNAGDAAMRDLQRAAQTGIEPDAGRHGLAFLGGLLFLVPGLWTDLAGLLLVLPPTQRLIRRRSGAWLSTRATSFRMPGVAYPGGDVIHGTVVRSDEPPASSTGDGPHPPRELP